MFTRQQVQDMNEKDLRQQILIPLLKAMNYQDAHEYHGTAEFGKDIVCWNRDDLNNRQTLALVVKATIITGNSLSCADIANQVCQCFGDAYVDPVTTSKELVNRCWVVSNKPISHDAVDRIVANIARSVYAGNVTFIGIDKLWELIEKYMPLQAVLQKLEDVQREYETLDTHYRLEAQIDGTGIHHRLVEKFPGAAQEKPQTFHIKFEFPNTEDGRAHMEALKRFHATGASVKIPATYIKNLEYPDILKQIYPAMTPDGFLQFGPRPHPKPLLLSCEIVSDDGDRFVIDYIHLTCIQGGQKEITLTNESQPIPFKIQQVIRFDGSMSGFHMSTKLDPLCNVHQQLLHARLLRCISKPHTMHFTNLETGMPVASGRNEAGVCETPHEEFIEALAALDALQIKSGKLVHLPDRDLTEEELQDIAMLRSLFRTGTAGFSWHSLSASMVITDEDRTEQMQTLQQYANGGLFYHILQQEEILSLFGEQYLLGPIKPLSLPLALVNWSEIQELLDTGYCGELSLEFVPRDDGSFTKEYVNWLPEQNALPAETLLTNINAPSD